MVRGRYWIAEFGHRIVAKKLYLHFQSVRGGRHRCYYTNKHAGTTVPGFILTATQILRPLVDPRHHTHNVAQVKSLADLPKWGGFIVCDRLNVCGSACRHFTTDIPGALSQQLQGPVRNNSPEITIFCHRYALRSLTISAWHLQNDVSSEVLPRRDAGISPTKGAQCKSDTPAIAFSQLHGQIAYCLVRDLDQDQRDRTSIPWLKVVNFDNPLSDFWDFLDLEDHFGSEIYSNDVGVFPDGIACLLTVGDVTYTAR